MNACVGYLRPCWRWLLALVVAIAVSGMTVSAAEATPPSVPLSVMATPGPNQVTLTWQAPSSSGSAPVNRYAVAVFQGGQPLFAEFATGLTFTFRGLVSGSAYQFAVRAYNTGPAGDEGGPWSSQLTATPTTKAPLAPGTPTNVVGIPGNEEVTVTWADTANPGGPITGHWVLVSEDGGTTWTYLDWVEGDGGGVTYAGAVNGVSYAFRVAAENSSGSGNYSIASTPVTPTAPATPASAPPTPTAVAGNAQATISWPDGTVMGTGTFTRWEVGWGNVVMCASTVITTRSCTATGLINGQSYAFEVRAVTNGSLNGAWSASSNPVVPSGAVPASAPPTPTAVAGNAQATITWPTGTVMGSGTFTKWEVAVNEVVVCTSAVLATRSCTATGLTNGAIYTFMVRAVTNTNVNGSWSAESNPVMPTASTVTPASAPPTPTAVAANAQATITWPTGTVMGTGTFTKWEVADSAGNIKCSSAVLATRSCTATGLTNGTSYTFKVRAVTNTSLNGAWSAVSNSVTPTAPVSASAPPKPTVVAGNGQVTVSWGAVASMGSGTFEKWEVANPAGNVLCISAVVATRSCTVTGLTNGTAYQFKARANTTASDGLYSVLSDAVTPTAPVGTAPTAPPQPTAVAGNTTVTITWDEPSTMGTGTFDRWEVANPAGVVVCSSLVRVTTTCTATGLANGTPYQFKVRATTSYGAGAYSPLSAVVIPLAPPLLPSATCQGLRATIVGTSASETIVGTPGNDVIVAGGGNDVVDGGGGADVICGGAGTDTIRGGAGNDRVSGGGGNDRLVGGGGSDRLRGDGGNDVVIGGAGRDHLYGGSGADTLKARDYTRDRVIDGGTGRDVALRDRFDPSSRAVP